MTGPLEQRTPSLCSTALVSLRLDGTDKNIRLVNSTIIMVAKGRSYHPQIMRLEIVLNNISLPVLRCDITITKCLHRKFTDYVSDPLHRNPH
jgi:hypothetical protein